MCNTFKNKFLDNLFERKVLSFNYLNGLYFYNRFKIITNENNLITCNDRMKKFEQITERIFYVSLANTV